VVYIYDTYKTPTVYYFLTYGGSDVDFYKNKNLESRKIENISEIKCDKDKRCLLGLICVQALENKFPYSQKIVYSQCPQWLYKVNFTNWMGRTVYNIYELDSTDTISK